ncbi:hypothetical protein J7413_02870 [Shimia sp. R10_1]|uniref:hypothetical protein n=1 Tax=Shimia sp. R10_1 TaxID=2821095 RepID=UPI001ADCBA8E|nr:hypothetical protein [Shimia sp. R10_1]MBO9472470.1 hypothetical protein [Shimia sp. R10_1]
MRTGFFWVFLGAWFIGKVVRSECAPYGDGFVGVPLMLNVAALFFDCILVGGSTLSGVVET